MSCHYVVNNPNEKWCEKFPTVLNDEDGKHYCVFHAPKGKKGVTLWDFNNRIFDLIDTAKAQKKHLTLTGVVFEGDIDFQRFNKDNPLPGLGFYDAVFHGEACFSNTYCKESIMFIKTVFHEEARFINTVFEGIISFMAVKFQKGAHFISTEFSGSTDFMGVEFFAIANFLGAKFNKWTWFHGCKFEGYARFEVLNFSDNIRFQNTSFSQSATFANAKFGKEVLFEDTKFEKMTDFKNAYFYGKVSLLNTFFEEEADFSNVLFSYKSFIKGETFHDIGLLTNISIHDKLVLDGVSLKKTSLLDSDLREIDFYNCEWPQQKGWKLLYDEVLAINTKNTPASNKLFGKVEILYRQLKQKCKEENNEIETSNWHYREMEMQRKGASPLFIKIFLNIYYAASGYGENPRLALILLFLFFLLATFVLSICGLIPVNNSNQVCNVASVYWPQKADIQQIIIVLIDVFKYATYQKDYCLQPNSTVGHIVKILIQIFIPIQGALFVLALKNKFRR